MLANSNNNQLFLKRLNQIAEANLGDENFGVRELARMLGMSRSHIHRKLKSINKKSASEFIREIRLNKAKEMLMRDIDTVSEIAYKVGFGSPAYFIKCFHDYFGYPPGEYKKYALVNFDGSETILNSEQSSESKSIQSEKIESDRNGILRIILFGLFGILTIATITIFIYNLTEKIEQKGTNLIIKDKSIAVLPLKNESENIKIQHLASGIMDDILSRLSHIHEFKVKSRTSSERNWDADMSLRDIAKEMDVAYILEGGILSENEKVRIYVQLIEAKTDNHIWTDQYDGDLSDIFTFTSDVSKQIASKLEVVLSPHEIVQIEKKYTDDKEAYNFYLLGRFFWHRRTEEDLKNSVKYFNQAIARDSNYSLAYAGLSDAYNSMSGHGWYPKEEGIEKSREYALKAVSLDNNLAEAHASLGDVAADFDQNWELAEKELKLAIKLNPNFALAYKYYAGYLTKIGKHTEARININKAIELNPESLPIWQESFMCYYSEGNFEEALKDFEILLEFQEISLWDHWNRFKIYFHLGKDTEALNDLQKFLLIGNPDEDYSNQLNQIYSELGINGIMHWLVEDYLNLKGNYFMAFTVSALIEDNDSAIEYMEKCSDTVIRKHLHRLNNDYEYRNIRNEPRFTAFLEKVNMADK